MTTPGPDVSPRGPRAHLGALLRLVAVVDVGLFLLLVGLLVVLLVRVTT